MNFFHGALNEAGEKKFQLIAKKGGDAASGTGWRQRNSPPAGGARERQGLSGLVAVAYGNLTVAAVPASSNSFTAKTALAS